jgi:hypothetical protein
LGERTSHRSPRCERCPSSAAHGHTWAPARQTHTLSLHRSHLSYARLERRRQLPARRGVPQLGASLGPIIINLIAACFSFTISRKVADRRVVIHAADGRDPSKWLTARSSGGRYGLRPLRRLRSPCSTNGSPPQASVGSRTLARWHGAPQGTRPVRRHSVRGGRRGPACEGAPRPACVAPRLAAGRSRTPHGSPARRQRGRGGADPILACGTAHGSPGSRGPQSSLPLPRRQRPRVVRSRTKGATVALGLPLCRAAADGGRGSLARAAPVRRLELWRSRRPACGWRTGWQSLSPGLARSRERAH